MMRWQRLFFTKKDIDAPPGYKWVLSPYKLFGWLIGIAVLLFIIYALLRSDTEEFLRESLVWGMIGLVVVAIFILIFGFTKKMKDKMKGYLIALTIIGLIYFILSALMNYVFGISFNYGYGAWILMLTLAGFHQIDGKLDFRDVLYGCFIIISIIGANLPFGPNGKSILDNLTWLVSRIFQILSDLDFSRLPTGNFTKSITNIFK
ncbi:MAG: hypothetical protein DRI61_17185 [Chloroflexi bacterium]|nr:MAG: hypothetical protein DRI61_17185 [Chloroflexota bacterium]